MKKAWGGRFEKTTEAWIEEFGASILFDQTLVEEDIQGSIAHVTMLGACGILPMEDVKTIKGGLEKLSLKAKEGALSFKIEQEDIHLNIEKMLIDDIGEVGGKLHTGRSRNDQVATDMHVYMRKEVIEVIHLLRVCQQALLHQAEEHVETILPGYTHLQRAQPISFAHHLLAYFWMFDRDIRRLQDSLKRINVSPLGCGALAGTTFPIDRHYTAELLGFDGIYANSLDGVSDRDFIIEFLSNASMMMMHLSRFCEELILWSSQEFQFVEIDDAYATGSSMMPQKKNPDMAELIRGKTGRVYGNLMSLLTVMKGLPLAYNKDLQEDKEGMFDTVTTLKGCLTIMTGMIETLQINKEKMYKATTQDFSNATELADYLAEKGIPFREAHEIVGKLVLLCLQQGVYLQDLPMSVYKETSVYFEEDIYKILDVMTVVSRRNSTGGTGFAQVQEALRQAKKQIDE
ncbi:argininosuccinate lyase [Priestia taiwanensis]|uniref:Argininosuccinate lyase n=1 Tax=Priestia taiwanensis TaxID=1347902 RepID=A0A917AV64_9BACI|nr:argininosuccinate lyase [Priestia taiwanensis]MBM7363448.1 argininosuccinate lyase [Priestia taiwanensis]GGE77063.1 argininosuccinate lyase [Priestia taiwanensis]